MKMKIVILITVAKPFGQRLLLLGCVGYLNAQETIQIQVDPNTVLSPISDNFIGFGYETSALAREGFFSAKNTHMVQLYRTLSLNGLVRIGGIIGDHTHYETEGKTVANDQTATTVINRAVLVDLGGFLRATGWKAMWTLNLGTGSKEEAVEEALAVQSALGDRLQSFEIGNEVDHLKRFKNYEEYHAAYLDYKVAIRAVLPQAVFSGPDTTGGHIEWMTQFAETESKDMKLLITHYYRGSAKSPKSTVEFLLTPAPDAALDAKLKTLQEICRGKPIAFRINEVNSLVGGGKKDVSDTFASALWCLDFMFRVATYGGAGVNMETDVNQHAFISHYSPIFRNEDGSLTARPEYYGMLAFSLAGKGDIIKLTRSESPVNLTAYATKDTGSSIWATLVNKDLMQSAKIDLTVPDGYSVVEGYRLAAPTPQSTENVTLAETAVSSSGSWAPKTKEKIPVSGKKATLTVPPFSALLVNVLKEEKVSK